jgi:hypothetical protein
LRRAPLEWIRGFIYSITFMSAKIYCPGEMAGAVFIRSRCYVSQQNLRGSRRRNCLHGAVVRAGACAGADEFITIYFLCTVKLFIEVKIRSDAAATR